MTSSLVDLPADALLSITKAAGPAFDGARVLGKLRRVSRSFGLANVTSDERIGREILQKLRFMTTRGEYRPTMLSHTLHLNRTENTEFKEMCKHAPRLFIFAGDPLLSASAAFDVVKRFLAAKGGWSGQDMRTNRKMELDAKRIYNTQRVRLQSRISSSGYQKEHAVEQAQEHRRKAAEHDERASVATELTKQLDAELKTLKRDERQRLKLFAPPTKKMSGA